AVCSPDGGVSWTRDFRVSGPTLIDTSVRNNARKHRLGEYISLAARPNSDVFHGAWTTNGPTGDRDIATATFTCPSGPFFTLPEEPETADLNLEPSDQVIAVSNTSRLALAA